MSTEAAIANFLSSSTGVLLAHALIGLLNAVTLTIVERNRRHASRTEERLDRYVRQLMHQIHGGHTHD